MLTSFKMKRNAAITASVLLCAFKSHASSAAVTIDSGNSVSWQSGSPIPKQDHMGVQNHQVEDTILLRRGVLQDLNEEPYPELEDLAGPVSLHSEAEADGHHQQPLVVGTMNQPIPIDRAHISFGAQGSQNAASIQTMQSSGTKTTQSIKGKHGKADRGGGMGRSEEKRERLRVVMETLAKVPHHTLRSEQYKIHSEALVKAGLLVPAESRLHQTISWARRKMKLKDLATRSSDYLAQYKAKNKRMAVVRSVASFIRDRPKEERQEILSEAFEKNGIEKPSSFDLIVQKMSFPSVKKTLAKNVLKPLKGSIQETGQGSSQPATSIAHHSFHTKNNQEAHPHARSLSLGNAEDNHALLHRGLRQDGLEIDLNSTPADVEVEGQGMITAAQYVGRDEHSREMQRGKRPAENDLESGPMTRYKRTRAGLSGLLPSEGQASVVHNSQLVRDGHSGKVGLAIKEREEEKIAEHSEIVAGMSKGPILTMEEASKMTKPEWSKAGIEGRLPDEFQRKFDYRSQKIREGYIRRAANQHLGFKEYRSLVSRQRADVRRLAHKGKLSEEDEKLYTTNQDYFIRQGINRIDITKPVKKTSLMVMREITRRLLAVASDKDRVKMILDAHIEAGLKPPTEKEAKNKIDHLKYRSLNNPLKVKEVKTLHVPKPSQSHFQRRGEAPLERLSLLRRGVVDEPNESKRDVKEVQLTRRTLDLNASPQVSEEVPFNSHYGRNDEQEFTSRPFQLQSAGFSDPQNGRHDQQHTVEAFRLFNFPIHITQNSKSSHDAAIQTTPSTAPIQSRKRESLDPKYEGKDMKEVRQQWKLRKLKQTLKERERLPKEQQVLSDIRSKSIKKSMNERKEFEAANPDKKGDFKSWRSYKNKDRKLKRKKYIKNELSPEDLIKYEERRQAYSHLVGRPYKPPKQITIQKVMWEISKDLQQIDGFQERKDFIAQAIAKAGLPIPHPSKLAEKSNNARTYYNRMLKRKGKIDGASKSTS